MRPDADLATAANHAPHLALTTAFVVPSVTPWLHPGLGVFATPRNPAVGVCSSVCVVFHVGMLFVWCVVEPPQTQHRCENGSLPSTQQRGSCGCWTTSSFSCRWISDPTIMRLELELIHDPIGSWSTLRLRSVCVSMIFNLKASVGDPTGVYQTADIDKAPPYTRQNTRAKTHAPKHTRQNTRGKTHAISSVFWL